MFMIIKRTNLNYIRNILLFILVASIINIAIFIIIQQLVSNTHKSQIKTTNINLVDFIKNKQSEKQVEPKKDKKNKDLKTKKPEPPPILSELVPPQIVEKPNIKSNHINTKLDIPLPINNKPYIGNFKNTPPPTNNLLIESNIKPTLRIEPRYPVRALSRGIEGKVTVEFTIDIEGYVKEPKIINSNPPMVFDKAVLTAIGKWKFKPKKINGKLISQRARQDIKFKIQK